jgi:hypothetical protein
MTSFAAFFPEVGACWQAIFDGRTNKVAYHFLPPVRATDPTNESRHQNRSWHRPNETSDFVALRVSAGNFGQSTAHAVGYNGAVS